MSAKSQGLLRTGAIVVNRIPPNLETQPMAVIAKLGGNPVANVYKKAFRIMQSDELVQPGDVYPVVIAGNVIQEVEVKPKDNVVGRMISTLSPGLWLRPVQPASKG